MKIYVGRWDLFLAEYEGYNGLVEMSRADAVVEIAREIVAYAKTHTKEDRLMGVYTAKEFEDTFNQDLANTFNPLNYWIRIFE